MFPVAGMAVAVFLLAVGRYFTAHIRQLLPLSTGKFLFNFTILLIVPSFMIVAFSVEASHIDYGMFEISYFIINGFCTWLALYMIIQVFQQDKKHYLEFIAYSVVIYVVIFTLVIKEVKTEPPVQESVEGEGLGPDIIHSSASLGIWEYIAIAVMIGFRFIYSLHKFFVVYQKNKERSVNQDSFSEINVS